MKKRSISLFLTVLMVCAALSFTLMTANAASADWGVAQSKMGEDGKEYTYYVDADGRVSAMIGDDDITWLYINHFDGSDDSGVWFGIDNPVQDNGRRIFDEGSRFSVAFIGRDDSPIEWSKRWNMISTDARRGLHPMTTKFCDVSVTNPNGIEYGDFRTLVHLFTNADLMLFDSREKQGVHLLMDLPMGNLQCPDPGSYGVILLNNFDDILFMDMSDNWQGSVLSDAITPESVIIIGVAALAAGLVGGFFLGKRKSSIVKTSKAEDDE